MRYWFSAAPLVIVIGTLAFVFSPILVLAAMTLAAFGVLAAIVAIPVVLVRSVGDRWQQRHEAGQLRSA